MESDFDFDKLVKKETINLKGKGLSDDDLDVLIQVIEQSTVLVALSLSDNQLTLSDGKLANAIAKNKSIKRLDLFNNKISHQGIKHLADALKQNNTPLKELYLGCNNIGDEGSKYLADMLAINKTLQEIDLSHNSIGTRDSLDRIESILKNRKRKKKKKLNFEELLARYSMEARKEDNNESMLDDTASDKSANMNDDETEEGDSLRGKEEEIKKVKSLEEEKQRIEQEKNQIQKRLIEVKQENHQKDKRLKMAEERIVQVKQEREDAKQDAEFARMFANALVVERGELENDVDLAKRVADEAVREKEEAGKVAEIMVGQKRQLENDVEQAQRAAAIAWRECNAAQLRAECPICNEIGNDDVVSSPCGCVMCAKCVEKYIAIHVKPQCLRCTRKVTKLIRVHR